MDSQLSKRELALSEEECIRNARLDLKLAHNHDKFPTAIYFIIPNEFCERFCYFGIKNLLNQYLKRVFGYTDHEAKSQVHLFSGFVYLFPLVGAAISDSFLGKYRTILYFSLVYMLGNVLLSVSSINGAVGAYGSYPYYAFIVPVLLIAIGSGGIKPCVATHGGDQFLPTQTLLMDKFFSFFYASISVGTLLSQYVTPYLKENIQCFGNQCYFLAFGLPTVAFGLALLLFLVGRRYYRAVPVQGEFLPWKAVKLMSVASYRWLQAPKAQRRQAGSWLKFAEPEYESGFVEETRLFGKVVVMFMPIVFFWTMLSQCGTEWQNQYERMNKQYLGFIPIPTEASSNIGAILISVMVPSLVKWVYPFLERRGMDMCLVNRMLYGFFFLLFGFLLSTSLNYYVDAHTQNIVYKDHVVVSCEGCVNGAWQLPQWFLMALAESLLCPTGIHFCYTQVGKQLKASSFSIFLLSASIGNYLIIFIDSCLTGIRSPTNRQWIYLAIASLAFLALFVLAKFWYVSKEDEEKAKQSSE